MEKIRQHYPALRDMTYLNSCSSGLFSTQVLDFRRQLDEDFQRSGSRFRAGVYGKIRTVKETIAQHFGGEADRTALIPSCSHGINLVLESLAQGQRVLHLPHDYPSIVWPFESRDFTCLLTPEARYDEGFLAEQIQAQGADILAVSMVQYSNGEIIPPQTFRALKDRFPDLLILVDATQYWGIAPFDFAESGIDLFAASAFKWMCAGYGNGVLFLSPQMEDILRSRVRGYNTYKNPRREGQPTPGEYFEPGHQDLLSFQSLRFQVEALAEIGFDNIQEQIRRVKQYARDKIESSTSYSVITSRNPVQESGILSVDAPQELVRHLNNENVICSYNRGLRLGIHFYNNTEDIDRLVAEMKKYKG